MIFDDLWKYILYMSQLSQFHALSHWAECRARAKAMETQLTCKANSLATSAMLSRPQRQSISKDINSNIRRVIERYTYLIIHNYQVVPGTRRGRGFWKKRHSYRKIESMAYRKALAIRSKCWSCEVHHRMSKRLLRCQWNDIKESAHKWVNEPMSQWANEFMNQWTNESASQRIHEPMKQRSNDLMNQATIVNQYIIQCSDAWMI